MRLKSSIFAGAVLGLPWLTPALAQGLDDLNRPEIYQLRPGITGCGRDRLCDWQEPGLGSDRDWRRPGRSIYGDEQRRERSVNSYRQPQIDYDLAVPMESTQDPLPDRGRLGLRQTTIQAHRAWCMDRYRSYDRSNDTFQPYTGARRRCISPYVQ